MSLDLNNLKLVYSKVIIEKDFEGLEMISSLIIKFLNEIKEERKFILLFGELGVGKTTLTKEIISNFSEDLVSSPTYDIIRRYENKLKKNSFINHFDFFRINNQIEENLFYEFKENSISIIEWPDNFIKFWNNESNVIKVYISLLEKKRREIKIYLPKV